MQVRLLSRLVACLTLVAATASTVSAWEAPYVEEGIERGIAAAKKLKDLSGFGARSDGICLIGGFMEVHGEITWKCNLKGGKDYIFVGAGDKDVQDLDLEAYEGDKLVAHDSEEDNTPIVLLKVEGDAEVTMKMKLAKAPGEGQKHFNVMIMLESEGTGGKLSQLESVAKQLNDACAKVTDKGDLQFDQEPNTVCLVAGLLESGGEKAFNRTFAKNSKYVFVGAGDDACVDLDLHLIHEDKVIAQDTENDATPVVTLAVGDDSATCTVKMIMHESKKASFSVVGILTVK